MVRVALEQQLVSSHPVSTPDSASIKKFVASRQAQLFQSLKQPQFSGQLVLKDTQGQASIFYLYLGRIVYATGGTHPVRRWQRHLSYYCPEIVADTAARQRDHVAVNSLDILIPWDYQLLCLWGKQQRISREQLTKMIRAIATEILFDLTQAGQVTYTLKPEKFSSPPMILIDADQVIVETWKDWQAWQEARLADRSPNQTAIIKNPQQLQMRTSPLTYQLLKQRLNGHYSLRDLAVYLQQDVLSLTRSLVLYIQWGYVELVNLADLPTPSPPTPQTLHTSHTSHVRQGKLIACVDERSHLSRMIEMAIAAADYDFISATDELSAIALFLEQKPDLIFVNLDMPNSNGYDVCRQLREIAIFDQTAIVLVAENLGILDRVRSKMVGCSEILSKPIKPSQVQEVMHRLLVEVRQ